MCLELLFDGLLFGGECVFHLFKLVLGAVSWVGGLVWWFKGRRLNGRRVACFFSILRLYNLNIV